MKKLNRILSAALALSIGSTLIAPAYNAINDKDLALIGSSSYEDAETDSEQSESLDTTTRFHAYRFLTDSETSEIMDIFPFGRIRSAEEIERETNKTTVSFDVRTYQSNYSLSRDRDYNRDRIGMWIISRTAASKNLHESIMQELRNNLDTFADLHLNYDFMVMSNYGYDLHTYSVNKDSDTVEVAQRLVYTIREIAERMGCDVKVNYAGRESNRLDSYNDTWNIEIKKDL